MIVLNATGDPVSDTRRALARLAAGESLRLDPGKDVTTGRWSIPWRINQTLMPRRSGQVIEGAGPRATVIEWHGDPAAMTPFAVEQNQAIEVRDVLIVPKPGTAPTGGAAVVVRAGDAGNPGTPVAIPYAARLSNVWVLGGWDGFHVLAGTGIELDRCQVIEPLGGHGLLLRGQPLTYPNCSINSVVVRGFVGSSQRNDAAAARWIVMSSWSATLRIEGAVCVGGLNGLVMEDPVGDPAGSWPQWVLAVDLESDHAGGDSILLTGGQGFVANGSWWGSSLRGCGLRAEGAFLGNVAVDTTEIRGAALDGAAIMAGTGYRLNSCNVAENGNAEPHQRAGIGVGGTARDVSGGGITTRGFDPRLTSVQGWGLHLMPGCDEIDFSHNNFRGNTRGGIRDEAPAAVKVLVDNLV